MYKCEYHIKFINYNINLIFNFDLLNDLPQITIDHTKYKIPGQKLCALNILPYFLFELVILQ